MSVHVDSSIASPNQFAVCWKGFGFIIDEECVKQQKDQGLKLAIEFQKRVDREEAVRRLRIIVDRDMKTVAETIHKSHLPQFVNVNINADTEFVVIVQSVVAGYYALVFLKAVDENDPDCYIKPCTVNIGGQDVNLNAKNPFPSMDTVVAEEFPLNEKK